MIPVKHINIKRFYFTTSLIQRLQDSVYLNIFIIFHIKKHVRIISKFIVKSIGNKINFAIPAISLYSHFITFFLMLRNICIDRMAAVADNFCMNNRVAINNLNQNRVQLRLFEHIQID